MTRATIEVHHFFVGAPKYGSLRSLPNTDLEKKSKPLPDEKSYGLGIQRDSCKKKMSFYDSFGFRSPVIQKPFQTKSATSIVVRVR